VTSDHDQPPASGAPTTPRLRPRTLDLPAEEAAPEPIRTTGPAEDEAIAAGPADTGTPHHDAAADASSSDTVSGDAPPPSPADEPPADAPRRRGWLPAVSMIWAGVLGAAIVLAVLGSMGLLVNPNDGLSAVDARLAGLELEVRDLAARAPAAGVDARALDEVVGRVDTLEAAVVTSRPETGDPSFSNRIAAINGEVKALAETIGTLGRRNDEAAAAARAAQTRSDATAAAVATLAQKLPAGAAVERSQVEALAARVAAVETSEKTAARGDQAVRLVLVATALKSAVERGDPFAGELAAAKALGADAKLTTALEPFAASGVPTSAALARELAALAPSLRPAASAPAREGFLERLQGNAEKLVRVRPTDEVAGSDAAAIASRVETKAAQEDIAGAQAELAKLSTTARAPAEAWLKQAQARTAALDASRRLAADALAGLGK
jgi:hypothetical protein